MNLTDIQYAFNRAIIMTLSIKKLLLTFIVLALCGLLVVFFRGLAIGAGEWTMMSLTFMPIFICAGVLLSMGIVLIRIYHNEIKNRVVSYRDVLQNSWELLIGASYFSIPIILSYLALWILLGIFVLLTMLPGIGDIFSVVLSFAPFLLNLATLILCCLNLAVLFFVTPVVALKGLNRIRIAQTLSGRIKKDPFSNIILAILSVLPMVVFGGILLLAAFITGTVCHGCENSMQHVLQWFFIMIPFTAFLSPAVVFFFNFAAESHVLLHKEAEKKLGSGL